MEIAKARFPKGHEDRTLDLEEQFDDHISNLIAAATDAGYEIREAVEAIKSTAAHVELALSANADTASAIVRARRGDA